MEIFPLDHYDKCRLCLNKIKSHWLAVKLTESIVENVYELTNVEVNKLTKIPDFSSHDFLSLVASDE